jgi:CHAT domain-containing protein
MKFTHKISFSMILTAVWLTVSVQMFNASAPQQDQTRLRATQLSKEARATLDKPTPLSDEEARQCLAKLEEALQLWQSLGDQLMIGDTLLDTGLLHAKKFDYTKALEFYEQSLSFFPPTDAGNASKASALNNIANVHQRLGETQKALQIYQQSLALKKPGKSKAITVDNIGGVYHRLGEYQLALEHHQQALAAFRELGLRRDEAVAINNVASVYGFLGDMFTARDYLLQALALIRQVGDKEEEATNLYNLGMCSFRMSEYRQTLDYANQTITLSREIKDRFTEADGITLKCRAHLALGETETALNECARVLPIHQANRDRLSEAMTQSALGEIFERNNETAKAVEARTAALAIFRASGDANSELEMLRALGQLAINAGDLVSARRQLDQAMQLSESLRAKVGSQQLRSTYMAGLHRVHETYVDLLMQLHRQEPDKGYEKAALQFAERARARGLLDLLAESRAQIRQGADAALLAKERELLQRLNDKDSAWKRLRANPRMKEQADKLALEVRDLTTQLEIAEAQVRASSPRFAELTQPQPITVEDIQTRLLDDDTVLLEFALGKKRSWLWAVTPKETFAVELPARQEIEPSARKVYELLTVRQPVKGETDADRQARIAAASAAFPEAAAALSQKLFAPVAAKFDQEWKGKRLLIVASGALEYLPFAALPEPQNLQSLPLIANHEIVNLPSASALAAIRRETANRKPAAKTLAVFADPVFDANDPRVLLAAKKNQKNELAVNVRSAGEAASPQPVSSDLLRAVSDFNRGVLSRLPFSREEADNIAQLVPRASLLKATDFQASHSAVASGELSRYRILHFATHGLLNGEHPKLSGLVFSMVNDQGKPLDGFLRSHELFNLQLPADLVVLSACQTALGKQIKGEGLVGMTRGFMYAGAARVVASLWQVDDLATSELMERFYRGMLKDNQRPAAALRAAQLEMMKQRRWASPYFWAAFTLQGEWR